MNASVRTPSLASLGPSKSSLGRVATRSRYHLDERALRAFRLGLPTWKGVSTWSRTLAEKPSTTLTRHHE